VRRRRKILWQRPTFLLLSFAEVAEDDLLAVRVHVAVGVVAVLVPVVFGRDHGAG
jgi:hypothetical protein